MVEYLDLIPSGRLLLETAVHGTSLALFALEGNEFVTVQFDDKRERRREGLPMAINTVDERKCAGIIGHDILVGHLIVITTVVDVFIVT